MSNNNKMNFHKTLQVEIKLMPLFDEFLFSCPLCLLDPVDNKEILLSLVPDIREMLLSLLSLFLLCKVSNIGLLRYSDMAGV